MKLYLLTQNIVRGYDTYDSCVVCAPDEQAARQIHPSSAGWDNSYVTCWAETPSQVAVVLLGHATPNQQQRIICASFNAG